MQSQKYSVNQHQISAFLTYVKTGQIAIPEVQRPFVWDSSQVRDLMDSLYKGYPIGYVITWQNPNIRLKDGSLSEGKKILIDGQQRITALKAAILGDYVVNKEYDRIKIKIAFNPQLEKFEVQNTAILKDKAWIPDISDIMQAGNSFQSINNYIQTNPDVDQQLMAENIQELYNIQNKQIGVIDLAHDLDIETVTEIFIRINSQGVVLSQADFAMSKMASNEKMGGHQLRKAIDYFCHLATAPHFYDHVKDNDKEFASTDFFAKMTWLKDEKDDLYDPGYTDMLRVAFTSEFKRGKMSDLVSLLAGRNFETREFEESIAIDTYKRMKNGIMNFMHEDYFKKFLIIIRSAGFVAPHMIRSQNAMNFAYILYLKLRIDGVKQGDIETYVKKWFVFSVLTSRYGSSPESTIDYDIKQIASKPIDKLIADIEKADLSDAFWNSGLVQRLDTSVASSPLFHAFLASMVHQNDRGFLSKDVFVEDLIRIKGDVHHVFPKSYLKKNLKSKTEYNQIANFVMMQQEINISVGAKPPKKYFDELKEQCSTGKKKYGIISTMEELKANMKSHCIPESIFEMDVENYDEFLHERRGLIAQKIRNFYNKL